MHAAVEPVVEEVVEVDEERDLADDDPPRRQRSRMDAAPSQHGPGRDRRDAEADVVQHPPADRRPDELLRARRAALQPELPGPRGIARRDRRQRRREGDEREHADDEAADRERPEERLGEHRGAVLYHAPSASRSPDERTIRRSTAADTTLASP